ncbi:MAG: anaerobic ribonucleoside-triphosphate reductase [Candidatus Buchananbacteria bacterium]|nr:anaerobic ribonucleoside-triphosphate reductase [Candidatus Buchananbacteria bacterium]
MEAEKNKELNRQSIVADRQACEVYSRVVGYIRPVASWNPGKQSEYKDRMTYNVCRSECA